SMGATVARLSLALSSQAGLVARERAAARREHRALLDARRSGDLVAEAEHRYRELVEQVPAVVYLDQLDPDPRLTRSVYVSPRVLELTGYAAHEISADPELWGQLVADADRDRYLRAMSQRSEEHTSELQSLRHLVCRLLLE